MAALTSHISTLALLRQRFTYLHQAEARRGYAVRSDGKPAHPISQMHAEGLQTQALESLRAEIASMPGFAELRSATLQRWSAEPSLPIISQIVGELLRMRCVSSAEQADALPLADAAALMTSGAETTSIAPDRRIPKNSEGMEQLPTGKVSGVVSLNMLCGALDMLGFPDWRKRFESWSEVPFLRLRCVELFPGQPFSSATIELLMAWFQERGLTPDQARHLPLSEAVCRLSPSTIKTVRSEVGAAPVPTEQQSEAEQFARFCELHALVAAPERTEVPLETQKEYEQLQVKFGVYQVDCVFVGPPDPTRMPNAVPILNTDCIPIPGPNPLICPRSSPKLPVELLPNVETRFRSLRLVGPNQTILWVGKQARMETVCMYGKGCTCFEENPPPLPTKTKQSEEKMPAGPAPNWANLGDAKRAILTVLNKSKSRMQGPGIAKDAGYTHGSLRHHFKELQLWNYIDKGKGGYAITPTGAALVLCEPV